MKRLIVNADDFGRTPGINAGAIEAHVAGIVTSATVMILEPAAEEGIREAERRAPRLDLGLHVVLTGGGAPASSGDLPTLAPGGHFARDAEALPGSLDRQEIRREIAEQIGRFQRAAGRPPTHLDSHHHAARHPDVESVFAAAARDLGIPVRASDAAARERMRAGGLATPDAFLDGFYARGATPEHLRRILSRLSDGVSELMCHPGFPDDELRRTSTYAKPRAREIAILCDPDLLSILDGLGIVLAKYSDLGRR